MLSVYAQPSGSERYPSTNHETRECFFLHQFVPMMGFGRPAAIVAMCRSRPLLLPTTLPLGVHMVVTWISWNHRLHRLVTFGRVVDFAQHINDSICTFYPNLLSLSFSMAPTYYEGIEISAVWQHFRCCIVVSWLRLHNRKQSSSFQSWHGIEL